MTNRRALLVGAVGLVAAPFLVEAQPAGKVARVGVLDVGSAADSARQIASLSKALRELGHIEGQNITIEWRFAETQVSRLSNLAMELIALKPDVLVSRDVHGIRVLRNATTTIPIVMAGSDLSGHIAAVRRDAGATRWKHHWAALPGTGTRGQTD